LTLTGQLLQLDQLLLNVVQVAGQVPPQLAHPRFAARDPAALQGAARRDAEGPTMEPIVFISRHRIKEGKLEDVRRYIRQGVGTIEAEKPRTVAFQAYLDPPGSEVRIVHVFPDAEAMDVHFEGAAERAQAAYELIEPRGFEVFGPASESALGMLRQAERAGVTLEVWPESVSGFLRLSPA
jgi:quinol monooxygenase YgiN